MVDSHCHLDACREEPAALIERARAAGVSRLATVGTDARSAAVALELSRRHPEVFVIAGLHPHRTTGFAAVSLADHDPALDSQVRGERVVAVGETGLDFFRDNAPRVDQQRAFEAHIELARELGLPLVIHTRAAEEETFATLRERAEGLTVVLHCFSAPDRLEECVERGYVCSFAGNVTYPKAEALQRAAERVPDELLLVETDSPYLAPQARRGRANEPANVTLTARFVAERRGVAYEELEQLVDGNAARVFGW